MFWNLAADVVVVIHLFWIAFIIAGGVIARWIRWVKWIHIGSLSFSVLLQIFRWICPLTRLEGWLRQRADPAAGYPGDFIAHYAERLVYLPASPWMVLAATAVIVLIWVWVYWPRSDGDMRTFLG